MELAAIAGFTPLAQLTALPGNALIAAWKKKYKPWTVKLRRNRLAEFLRWLENLGAPRTALDALDNVRKPGPRMTIASEQEIEALLRAAAPDMRALLIMTSRLALRWNEALSATPRMWNRESSTITLPTKGHRQHILPMPDELATLFQLATHADEPDTPVIQLLAGKAISHYGIRLRWNALKKRAGVSPQLRPHDLRRTAATHLYTNTKDLRAVQQLLGHSHLASTVGYIAYLEPDKLRPLLAQLYLPKGEKTQ